MLTINFVASAQTPRSTDDPRNTAPTVGTGGPIGGPTGLFTVYDGQTLRRGEFTFSAAYSNYDRDPGDVDIDQIPLSFQIGLTDNIELFFNTDAYKSFKVNSPANLSGFYLPNSRLNGISPAAFVLAPQGPGANQFANQGILRPAGTQPFIQYPYVGGSAGTFGFGPVTQGQVFGFPTGFPTIGVRDSGGRADNFPGLGSPLGGILP
ncbi:MAG: hypothetical protein H7Z37_03315, partial [Pyrinomonadaceae bacterium]|nr:hypothetical protein [Pyrinomonadaceae bacterium]